jgi:hypothetical protein
MMPLNNNVYIVYEIMYELLTSLLCSAAAVLVLRIIFNVQLTLVDIFRSGAESRTVTRIQDSKRCSFSIPFFICELTEILKTRNYYLYNSIINMYKNLTCYKSRS